MIDRCYTDIPIAVCAPSLNNHLRNTMTSEGLAANEGLALDAGQQVADSRQCQEHTSSDQTSGTADGAQELHDRHHGVCGGAEVVCRDLSDDLIELGRRRADS